MFKKEKENEMLNKLKILKNKWNYVIIWFHVLIIKLTDGVTFATAS